MKKVKKKVRFKGVIFLILFGYLIIMFIYYLFAVPVKNIIVKGNYLLEEQQVLESAKVDNNTSIFKIVSTNVCRKALKNDLINDCHYKITFPGTLTLTITENKLLFFNEREKVLVLSDATKIKNYEDYIGYPTLINYVPKDIYKKLIKKLSLIDPNTIRMISEIEYSPDKYDHVVVDDERFLLRMNDGNQVFINIVNMKKLSKYPTIVSNLSEKGVLYLDSSSKTYIFKKYTEAIETEK